MTEKQLDALMSYTSAVAMYVAGDGNFKRMSLSARLLENAFGVRLDGKKPTPSPIDLFAEAVPPLPDIL